MHPCAQGQRVWISDKWLADYVEVYHFPKAAVFIVERRYQEPGGVLCLVLRSNACTARVLARNTHLTLLGHELSRPGWGRLREWAVQS